MLSADELQQIKDRVRYTWALGDYRRIADRQLPIAQELCAWTGVGAGERLLDLGTATGNVALTAAQRGAQVSALDLTPRMLELARARAREQELVIEFVEGDMEALPFGCAAFDVVLSACGAWFAPRPDVVTQELHRVLRPGGHLGLANFTPTGYMGEVNKIVTRRLPLPLGIPEPNEWGREEVVRGRLSTHFDQIECRTAVVLYGFPSAPAATAFFASYSPPHVAAARELGAEAAGIMLSEIEAYTADNYTSGNGIEVEAEYLLVRARSR